MFGTTFWHTQTAQAYSPAKSIDKFYYSQWKLTNSQLHTFIIINRVINITTITNRQFHRHTHTHSNTVSSVTKSQQQRIMICSNLCEISASRERLPDEIIPVNAEQSRTANDNEKDFAAARAIDGDLDTRSNTSRGSDGKVWLKLNLAKLNCIQQVIRYRPSGDRRLTWTCTNSNCSTCKGDKCSQLLLTTSIERTSSDDLPLIADCKYGDTINLERVKGDNLGVYEIAITGKRGEIRFW